MTEERNGAGRGGAGGRRFPLEVAVLFLLLFMNLPLEGQLEFGKDHADLARVSGAFARFFDRSLVDNPIGGLKTSVAVGLLALYALVSFGVLFKRRSGAVRAALLVILIAWIVFAPAIVEITLRFEVGPRGHAHDGGVIQTEEAVRFFLRGISPYAADYRPTPMAALDWGPGNPAIIHHPYFPLSFLVHLPFFAIGETFFGGYDARILYLLLFCIPFFLVPRWSDDPERKRILTALWGLNPFLVPHIIEGRNDVVVAVLLVASMHLLLMKQRRGSALLLGLACATKQFAFLLVPFYLVSLGRGGRGWAAILRRGARAALPGLIPVAILVLPFFFWTPGDFVDDTYAFNVGVSEVSYPLGGTPGFGLANLVNVFRLAASRYHYFPFWVPQLLFVLPVGLLLMRRHRTVGTVASLMTAFALFLFVFLCFSRIFHHNYFGLIFFFLAAPAFGEKLGEEEGPSGAR